MEHLLSTYVIKYLYQKAKFQIPAYNKPVFPHLQE